MRKYIRQTLLFLLLVAVGATGIELFLRSIPNPYRYKDEWLHANHRPQTLILGNSHNYYAVTPSLLGGQAFNAANVSQRFDQDLYLLQRYTDANPSIRRVVINVDFSNLFDPPLAEEEPFRLTYYHLYMAMPIDWHQWQSRIELGNIAAARKKFSNFLGHKAISYDSLGWGTGYQLALRSPYPFSKADCRRRAKDLRCENEDDYHHNVHTLMQIVMACRHKGLRLFVVSTPVHPAYYACVAKGDKDRLRKTTNALGKYSFVRYMDFSQDVLMNDSDFFDCDHLSDSGASKFSRQLDNYIQ